MTYKDFSDSSKVWIYQSSRPLTGQEANVFQPQLEDFARQWVSHNRDLKAFGGLFHSRFIVLMVDESNAPASGCSIDTSVRFLKEAGTWMGIDFFDRLTFAYREGNEIIMVPKEAFSTLYSSGKIKDDTIVFNNLVNTKTAFETQWEVPLKESWMMKFV